jgi:hypothetical protein
MPTTLSFWTMVAVQFEQRLDGLLRVGGGILHDQTHGRPRPLGIILTQGELQPAQGTLADGLVGAGQRQQRAQREALARTGLLDFGHRLRRTLRPLVGGIAAQERLEQGERLAVAPLAGQEHARLVQKIVHGQAFVLAAGQIFGILGAQAQDRRFELGRDDLLLRRGRHLHGTGVGIDRVRWGIQRHVSIADHRQGPEALGRQAHYPQGVRAAADHLAVFLVPIKGIKDLHHGLGSE